MFVALAMIAIGALMSWETLRYFMNVFSRRETPASAAPATIVASNTAAQFAPWQQDVLSNFQQATQLTKTGHITGAEMQVDQATSEMEDARVRSKSASVVFFNRALDALDGILKAQPSGPQDAQQSMAAERLFEHVTQARIELAAMRSLQQPTPSDSTLAADAEASAASVATGANAAGEAAAQVSLSNNVSEHSAGAPRIPNTPAGHIVINSPRELAANSLLDPESLGGTFLDASLMPDESEILLPPETRQFADNVRVEDLTIAGASQTLDGIHWHNVTFIGTRLRYEDGPLDLQNVRFVRCTFGFPSDERGASVANAIVLGKTSFTIQ